MLIIGLTGGIGSGKTTVANLFAELGVPIIDTDHIARDVTQPGTKALQEIIAHFDSSLLLPDQTLNRAVLRDRIFQDEKERKWLEALLHPLIYQKILSHLQQLSAPYCIIVIPLLFETKEKGFNTLINRVLVVDTDENTQIERITSRDHLSLTQIQNMLDAQTTREFRLVHADDVITNHGDIEELKPQVKKLHEFYLANNINPSNHIHN